MLINASFYLYIHISDSELMTYTGKTIVGAEYAKIKSIKDIDDREIPSLVPVPHFIIK